MVPPRQLALPVNNYRAGRRRRVNLLALHTTEGARTMESLAAFLRRVGGASYHAGTDDDKIGYIVNRQHEAWHLRNGNPAADGFVFCGFASWSESQWFSHPVMLENAAWWLAQCSRERSIPLRWLSHSEIREALRNPNYPGGVIHHDSYTKATGDGTHWDCGPNLPWRWILKRASELQSGTITTVPSSMIEDDDMGIQNFDLHSGKGSKVIICPVGSASGFDGRKAVLSASIGSGGGGIRVFAQSDKSGVHDWEWTNDDLKPRPGNLLARPWKPIQDGVTKLVVHWDLTDGGTLALETKPMK